ncbi:MAG: hypothetical protein NUV84_03960 [Candidatus Uhrbacteria bacterium]|nr:hypothetical protein [Candidatus Uhrbacteria bacterium]
MRPRNDTWLLLTGIVARGRLSLRFWKEVAIMPTLRLVRAVEPSEACENVDLRRTLKRLTYGTHDRQRGFVLLPSEAQALYNALAHRTFSLTQLEEIERLIHEVDPHEIDSTWNGRRLRSFVRARRHALDRPEWIDRPLDRLHAAMRSQGRDTRFRLWLTRAVFVIFLTTSEPGTDLLAG